MDSCVWARGWVWPEEEVGPTEKLSKPSPGSPRAPCYPSGSALSGHLHPCCTQSQWVNKNHLQQDRDPPRRPEYYSPARPSTAGWTVKCHTVHSREWAWEPGRPLSSQPETLLPSLGCPHKPACIEAWGFHTRSSGVYNGILLSHKKDKILPRMNLENNCTTWNKTKHVKNHIISLLCGIKNWK